MNKWKFRMSISLCLGVSLHKVKYKIEEKSFAATNETYTLILPFLKFELYKINVIK